MGQRVGECGLAQMQTGGEISLMFRMVRSPPNPFADFASSTEEECA